MKGSGVSEPWALCTLRKGLGASLVLGLAGCLVPAPSSQQVWEWGLDDPRMAYESFVTAFQGELLEAEYACFSTAFCERNQLSQGLYRAFRDDFLAKNRGLRWGLYRSQVDEITFLDQSHALLRASVKAPFVGTKRISVRMVREDYYEVRMANGDMPYFMHGPPERFDLLAPPNPPLSFSKDGAPPNPPLGFSDDGAYLEAQIDIGGRSDPALLADLIDVRFAREWRIDDIWLEEAD